MELENHFPTAPFFQFIVEKKIFFPQIQYISAQFSHARTHIHVCSLDRQLTPCLAFLYYNPKPITSPFLSLYHVTVWFRRAPNTETKKQNEKTF